jgi:putative phage-type endonuclease
MDIYLSKISENEIIEKLDLYLHENKYDMLNLMYDLFIEHISKNIMFVYLESFEYEMIDDCTNLLYVIINEHINNLTYDILSESFIWNEIITTSLNLLYSDFIPKREYSYSFIRKKVDIEKTNEKINYLRNKEQPQQRSEEWYAYRSNLITASNAWKIFDSESNRNNIIYEKCKPYQNYNSGFQNVESSLHWGQKYEPLSIMIYESTYNSKVEDFGCLQHDSIKCLGASPDGINVNENNDRFGRMLEIKNIVNREIKQVPKKEYWIQMQLQMEVCNLNECDFLETRFIEYENENEFLEDDGGEFLTKEGEKKGMIMCFYDDVKPIYEYYLNDTCGNYELWEKTMFEKYKDITYVKTIYWKLDEFSCLLILRNKKWFEIAAPMITDLWNIVLKERIEGFDHRAPKKRVRNLSIGSESHDDKSIKDCKINITTINVEDFD